MFQNSDDMVCGKLSTENVTMGLNGWENVLSVGKHFFSQRMDASFFCIHQLE